MRSHSLFFDVSFVPVCCCLSHSIIFYVPVFWALDLRPRALGPRGPFDTICSSGICVLIRLMCLRSLRYVFELSLMVLFAFSLIVFFVFLFIVLSVFSLISHSAF